MAVFKVAGKMFALAALGPAPGSVSLKCDPGSRGQAAPPLCRDHRALPPQQAALERGKPDGSVPEDELLDLINHSHELVVARLSRAEPNKLHTCR